MFLWDAAPDSKDGNAALDRLSKLAGKALEAHRPHPSRRDGWDLPDRQFDRGGARGGERRLPRRRARRSARLRIICDFGLVLGGDLKPDKKLVVRLQSADDFPGLPTDYVLATEAYAAQAKFDLGDKILLVPVGRAEFGPPRRTASGRRSAAGHLCRSTRPNGPKAARQVLRKFKPAAGCSGLDGASLA